MGLWAVSLLTGAVFFGLKFLHDASQRNHFRTLAEKDPKSYAYFVVKFFDYLYAITLHRRISLKKLRKMPSDGEAAPKSKYLESLHDYTGIKDIFEVRQSFSVSIDFSTRLSRRKIAFFGNPVNPVLGNTIAQALVVLLLGLFQKTSG